MSDYLKVLRDRADRLSPAIQDRAASLSSDWKAAEDRERRSGVKMCEKELLELRGRTHDLVSDVEAAEGSHTYGSVTDLDIALAESAFIALSE